MHVFWRELEREALQDHADGQLGLQQRGVLADADARPPAEGDEDARVAARLGVMVLDLQITIARIFEFMDTILERK